MVILDMLVAAPTIEVIRVLLTRYTLVCMVTEHEVDGRTST